MKLLILKFIFGAGALAFAIWGIVKDKPGGDKDSVFLTEPSKAGTPTVAP